MRRMTTTPFTSEYPRLRMQLEMPGALPSLFREFRQNIMVMARNYLSIPGVDIPLIARQRQDAEE